MEIDEKYYHCFMDDALSFFSAAGNRCGMMENRMERVFRKKHIRVRAFPMDQREDKNFLNGLGCAENYLVKGICI